MGARTESEARSFYVARLRRRMGVAAVREFARHRLRRVPYVGVPRAVVEQRMQREALRNRMNPTGNEDVTRIRNCETLRNGCESLRRHHWAVCEAARTRRESAAKPAKAPRNPRKRRESAAKKLRIRVTSPLPVGFCTTEAR